MSYRSIVFGSAVVLLMACNRNSEPRRDDARPAPAAPQAELTPNNNANPSMPAPASAPTSTVGAVNQAPLTDAQIAQITNDANSSEIEQAKVAEQHAKDARVKHFAEKMQKHHQMAKDKQAKLDLKTDSSSVSTELEKSAGNTLANLKALSGAAFDTAYMNAQVEEHQKVLDTINQSLLPNVKSEALKSYLDEMKSTVEGHLKEAQRLQQQLGATASAE
jgi:putative membrane protein